MNKKISWNEWAEKPPTESGYYWAVTDIGQMPVEVSASRNGHVLVYTPYKIRTLAKTIEEGWLWWTGKIYKPPMPAKD